MSQLASSDCSRSSAEGHLSVRYFVATGHGGGWLIFKEGRREALDKIPGKGRAVATAKSMAQADAPSQVIVEHADGRFGLRYEFDRSGELVYQ
jgi:hypothetical protein